jgi:hypothetical protein
LPADNGALRSVHTSNLPALFDQPDIDVVISTYQARTVIVVRSDEAALNTHSRALESELSS